MKETYFEMPNNFGGPIQFLGNRNLTLPDITGHMKPSNRWLNDHFSMLLSNTNGRKFRKAYEPLAGSASWSFNAMSIGLADEYHINDSNKPLMDVFEFIQKNPEEIKETYKSLAKGFKNTSQKEDFYIKAINDFNVTQSIEKSLLLPFIYNYSWGGIVFNTDEGDIVYHEPNFDGKIFHGYIEEPNLTLEQFYSEVDRVSNLLNTNKVIFKHGDYAEAIKDADHEDFVNLNPPYPSNERSEEEKTGIYVELYSPETLHNNLIRTLKKFEEKNIPYFMTYGRYDPKLKYFLIKDEEGRPKNYFQLIGHENCIFGTALNQVYLSPILTVPEHLSTKLIPAIKVLEGHDLTKEEALKKFKMLSQKVYAEQN